MKNLLKKLMISSALMIAGTSFGQTPGSIQFTPTIPSGSFEAGATITGINGEYDTGSDADGTPRFVDGNIFLILRIFIFLKILFVTNK